MEGTDHHIDVGCKGAVAAVDADSSAIHILLAGHLHLGILEGGTEIGIAKSIGYCPRNMVGVRRRQDIRTGWTDYVAAHSLSLRDPVAQTRHNPNVDYPAGIGRNHSSPKPLPI